MSCSRGVARFVRATLVITLAVLVKAVAVLALGALLLWIARQCGLLRALRAGCAAAAVVVASYVVAGGLTALRPLRSASERLSRASIWQFARRDGIEHLLGVGPAEPTRRMIAMIGPVALVVIAGVALLWVVSRVADPTPELVVVAGLAAFLLAGSYVLASYVMWVLPLVAWRHRAGLSRVVLLWSCLLLVAYQGARGLPTTIDDAAAWLGSFVATAAAVTGLVGLSIAAIRRLRAGPGTQEDPGIRRLAA